MAARDLQIGYEAALLDGALAAELAATLLLICP
jgi:hypothetical protein